MQNEHIKVGNTVPASIAIECYEKCIQAIEKNENFADAGNATCLLLPCILWDLKSYLDNGPDDCWTPMDTPKMFPEWPKEVIRKISSVEVKDALRNPVRIKLLKQAIKQAKIRQQHEQHPHPPHL